jgi:quinolinate synthase
VFCLVKPLIASLDHKKFLIMTDVHLIGRVQKALAKRQIINRVHQVGLSCPIIANKTIQPGRKLNINLFQIFKIDQRQALKIHGSILLPDKANKKSASLPADQRAGCLPGRS